MPSPNGYLSAFSYVIHDRQSFRVTLTHDVNSPPWLPGQGGSYTLVWETGPTAAGPWSAAPLTDLAVGCTPQPDNETTVGGVTSTLVRIGDPTPGTGTTADTDYFVRVTVLDPTDTQVDQWVLDTPAHTEAYPTFTCLAPDTTQTTADVVLGATAGQTNISAPCNQDTVTWEIATTSGGPYTAAPAEAVTGFSPGHTFTGLTADTTYYYRARFTEQAQSGGEYLTTAECSFTTDLPDYNPQTTPATGITTTGATVNGTTDGLPATRFARFGWSATAGGPYTFTANQPGDGTTPQAYSAPLAGLTPDTQYFYVLQVLDTDGTTVLDTSTESTFTTLEDVTPPGPPPFNPQPCDTGGGADAIDVEQTVLCDLDAEGNLLGTALAVYEYDATGAPVGPPTFVDPATGDPYVAQGTLQPCPDAACLAPIRFCFTSTSTGPVEHPGRQYDISLPINPGFAVDSLTIDNVTHAAGITWTVFDGDGETFRQALQTFMQGRFNQFGATVTITNPNAGGTVCGEAQPMAIHIECVRLDQEPPDLVELIYNGGVDKVLNPAYQPYTTFTTTARRTDAGGLLECTSVANRGWETNDVINAFEFWGAANATPDGAVTPTPRGTPVQEINANGSGLPSPNSGDTIWQTFSVSGAEAGSTFNIAVVVGGRAGTEAIRVRLFTGDPASPGTTPGDLIDTVLNAPKVTPPQNNPWTQYTNSIPLPAGTYTLAFTGPDNGSVGGLFTDMRAFIDRPGQRATAVNDDDTCSVTVDETTTLTECQWWQPQCVGGSVAGWENAATGERLTNTAFWGQAPAPSCCPGETDAGSGGEGGSVAANLVHNYEICALVGGVLTTLNRVVITDASGGVLSEQIIGPDGAPVAVTDYEIGACGQTRFMADQVLCDDNGPFLRKFVQRLDDAGPVVTGFRDFTLDGAAYEAVGDVATCPAECRNTTTLLVCDLPLGDPDGTPTVTDTAQQFIPDTANADFIQRPGGGGALWTGGVINFGPDVSPGPGPITQIHRYAAATLQATPPSCTDDTVHLSLSVNVLNEGPGAGCSGAGRFRLYRVSDGAVLSSGSPLVGTPAETSVTLTIEADIPAAELSTGNVAVWLDVETWQTGTCAPPDSKTWQASAFTASYAYGQEDCATQFFRTVVTDCETGVTLATVDTTPDGAPYVVTGEVGDCSTAASSPVVPAPDCTSCETLTLCDFGADAPALITGISTGGTLSNGVTWSGARGSAALFNPQHDNADGSWWGMPSFPNSTVAPDTWFFDRPVDVEFSVVIAHSPSTGAGLINQVQVPLGAELVSAAPDYSYDVATGIVTVDDSNTGDCTKVTNPTVANSARFRLRNVTQFTLDFLGQRIAICGQFSNWRFGSIAVTPSNSTLLRTVCRDCTGTVTTVTDTETDGTTPYAVIGPVGDCGAPIDAEPQCFGTQICVQPQGVQEFISNEANLTSTVGSPNIDPVWQWSNDPVAGPWFNMYDVGVFPGWVTVDPGTTEGVANWVAPHPNSSPITSGLPGEGPTIGPGNAEWYARAQFTLPADADPASIRIAATVLNADQLGVEFRLNDGAWQPVGASHVDPPFNFPAQVIPGAQAGLNEVFVHVRETVFGSGAAGVKMHLIASYNLGDQQSWTQIVCDDGTVSYFTNAGEQADALPDNWVIVPCGASGDAESCTTASAIGTVCYTPPVAVQTLQDDWAGTTSVAGGGSRVWTNSNFAGQGITVTETVTPDTGAALLGAGVRNTATSPATQHTAIDLGAPRTNVTVRVDFFGNNQGERLRNVSPAFAAVSGNGTAVLANTGVDGGPAGDGTIFLTFPGPVQNISWDYAPTGAGLSGQSFISFNTGNASNSAPAAVLRDCDTGETTYVDLATGTVLNPAAISIVDCDGSGGATPTARALVWDTSTDGNWTPAAVPGGSTLLGISGSVVTGSATTAVTGADGNVITNLPTGFSFSWSVGEDPGALTGPTLINGGTGRVLITYTVTP